jgi:hypothetical protein
MNILVSGSPSFSNYQTFIRGVGVAIDESLPRDSDGNPVLQDNAINMINIYSAGPVNINNYTAEFVNLTERSVKSMGYKIRYHRYPYRRCVSEIKNWDLDVVVTFGITDPTSDPISVTSKLSGIRVNSYNK